MQGCGVTNRREEMQKKLTFDTQVESGMLFRFRIYLEDKVNQFKSSDVDQWFDNKINVKKHKFSLELGLQFKIAEKFISLLDILNTLESKGLTLTDEAYAKLRTENAAVQKKLSEIPAGSPIPPDLQLFQGLNNYFNPVVKPAVNQHKAKVSDKTPEEKINSTKTVKHKPELEKPQQKTQEKSAPITKEKREVKFIKIFISKDGLNLAIVDHAKKLSLNHVKFWFNDFKDLEIGEFKDQTFIITLESDKPLVDLVTVLKRLQNHKVNIPPEILEKLRKENGLENAFLFKGLSEYLGNNAKKVKKAEVIKKPNEAKVSHKNEDDIKSESAEAIVIPQVKRKWHAFGRAPKVSPEDKKNFMAHPKMKNAMKLYAIEGDIQEALLDLVDYGALLYSECNKIHDKKSKNAKALKIKVDNIMNLISTTLSQVNLTSSESLDAIQAIYVKLETEDKNRGTGFYRVHSFFKGKYYEDEEGKSHLVRSKTGELAYNLQKALQKGVELEENHSSDSLAF